MTRSLVLGLALALLVSISACAKKKAPAAPAVGPDEHSRPEEDRGAKDEAKPDDPDDAEKLGADPCDGGE